MAVSPQEHIRRIDARRADAAKVLSDLVEAERQIAEKNGEFEFTATIPSGASEDAEASVVVEYAQAGWKVDVYPVHGERLMSLRPKPKS